MLYILFYSKSSEAFSPELYPNIYYRTDKTVEISWTS